MKESNNDQKKENDDECINRRFISDYYGYLQFYIAKIFLKYYGSSVNGLVSSISPFLTLATLCECGVGAVVQSAMYKPLAEHDNNSLSEIVISSSSFFRKIIYILIAYTIGLVIFYPLITIDSFDYMYTATLIMILSFSYFAQYYLFLTYRLLLNADQHGFIQLIIHSIALIVNTILSIVLIKLRMSIHIVKLVSSLVFICQPITLKLYVHKHYNLNLKIKFQGEPIKQKWNGFAQHIANVVLTNTDTTVLTLFSTLANVSIYSVYYLIVRGVRSVLLSMTTGIQAMFGNMYAKKEIELLSDTFSTVTWIINFAVTTIFTITGIMMVPFVSVYTRGVTDANYIQPTFSVLITLKLISAWFEDGDSTEITDDMKEFILTSGAYGTFLNTQLSQAAKQTDNTGDIKKARRSLYFQRIFLSYDRMCRLYPFLKKYMFLLPLCQIHRLIKAILFRKKELIDIKKVLDSTDDEQIIRYKTNIEKVGLKYPSKK